MSSEPQPLGAGFARLLGKYPPGSHVEDIAKAIVRATDICANRRAAVLKYPDLTARLPVEPRAWGGWLPPRIVQPGPEEFLRSSSGAANRRGKRACGEQVNDSPERALLVDIVNEAWKREHPPDEE